MTLRRIVSPSFLFLLLLVVPSVTLPQNLRVSVGAENFRASPNGERIGSLFEGTVLHPIEEMGGWVRATVEGWIWRPSLEEAGGALTVKVEEENLRTRPQGDRMGVLVRGLAMRRLEVRGRWVLVETEGWIWAQSVQPAAQPLTEEVGVSVSRENFRLRPNGGVLAQLNRGARVGVTERQGSWIRGRVEGWFWKESAEGSPTAARVAKEKENLRDKPDGRILSVLNRGAELLVLDQKEVWWKVGVEGWIWAPSTGSVVAGEGGEHPGPGPEARVVYIRPDQEALRATPGGLEVGVIRRGHPVEVVERQGTWTKVRAEGWVWTPSLTPEPESGPQEITEATVVEVKGNPEAYQGKVVRWRLEYISMERADQFRADFYPGEPYLLTRSLDQERSFVYVALPPQEEGGASGLAPFEQITVIGRVRTGRSQLLGNPILDLVKLEVR